MSLSRIQELEKKYESIDVNQWDKSFGDLDKWYVDAQQKLSEYYQIQKKKIIDSSSKLKEKVQKMAEEIQSLKSSIADQSETNNETLRIRNVKLDQMENEWTSIASDNFQVEIQPFQIDNFIQLKERFKLSRLVFEPPTIIYTENSSPAIAANDKHLLIHLESHICLLNHRKEIVKINLWKKNFIRDMCWSKKLNSFIVMTDKEIFLVNENLEIPDRSPLRTDGFWFSCTCSDDLLYLSKHEFGSSVSAFDLTNFGTINEWKSPRTCGKNEAIIDIQYNNDRIALAIYQLDKNFQYIYLKSAKDFQTVWQCPIGSSGDQRLFTCCPFNNDQWIFVYGTNQIIGQLSSDGKYVSKRKMDMFAYRAVSLGKDRLVLVLENSIASTELKPVT